MATHPRLHSEPTIRGPSLLQAVGGIAIARIGAARRQLAGVMGRSCRIAQDAAKLASVGVGRHPWLAPALLSLLLLPPAITWTGARVLILMEARRAERVRIDRADLLAANAHWVAAQGERARIAPLFTTPTISATVARLAEALPSDADLRTLGLDKNGVMTLTIAAPDPDRLREALHADALLGALRETNQRGGDDGRVWITLQGRSR